MKHSNNDPGRESGRPEETPELHEILCAYLLGEANADEIRRVEEALAQSEELRAERERLEKTLGVVRGAFPEEALSESAFADVLAKAEGIQKGEDSAKPEPSSGRPPLILLRSNWIKAAAAVMVVGVGAWTLQQAGSTQVEIAALDTERVREERLQLSEEELVDLLGGLGYVGGGAGGGAGVVQETESLNALGYSGSDMPDASSVAPKYDGRSVIRPASPPSNGAAPERRARALAATPGGAAGSGKGAYRGPGDTKPPGSTVISSDAFFLGQGEKVRSKPEPTSEDQQRLDYRKAWTKTFDELSTDLVVSEVYDEFSRTGNVDRWRISPNADERFRDEFASLTPGEREEYVRDYCRERLQRCYPRPRETPRDMYFRFWGDNQFQLTELDRLSTFSVDVDTASYALARRYLEEGNLPTKAQIRTEEFLNYFDPDLAPPTTGTFAIHTELAPSRFGGQEPRSMLRVGVRGRVIDKAERDPLSLTFVIDTSGSMRENNRLELVKHAVRLLVGELDQRDSIAIVAYSNEARVVLPLTPASQGGVIEAALYPLAPNGSTNAEAGLRLGYELAQTGLDPEKHHRVVFLSDGVANMGQTDQDRIAGDVKGFLDAGIYLNTIGVGMSNHNDVFLEQLANKGDGICDYIDTADAARRAIVERFTGAFQPIASDVKIQVEFDPKKVHRYRLLGYENRAIADKDFRNDAVDAGEVGAGHQVVALYELELASDAAKDSPLATVRLRYKAPKGPGQDPREPEVTELERRIFVGEAKDSFAKASAGYRRSAVVAQFAEFLRRSSHTYGDSAEALLAETAQLATELRDPDFDQFLGMVKRAYGLGLPGGPRGELDLTLDEFRRFQILRLELESLNRKLDSKFLEELEQQNSELEDRLKDVIRRELEKNG